LLLGSNIPNNPSKEEEKNSKLPSSKKSKILSSLSSSVSKNDMEKDRMSRERLRPDLVDCCYLAHTPQTINQKSKIPSSLSSSISTSEKEKERRSRER